MLIYWRVPEIIISPTPVIHQKWMGAGWHPMGGQSHASAGARHGALRDDSRGGVFVVPRNGACRTTQKDRRFIYCTTYLYLSTIYIYIYICVYIYMYVYIYICTQPFRSGIYFSISLGLLCTLLPPNLWPIETGNTRVFDDPLPTSYGHETLHRENQVWTTGNVGYLVFGRPPTIMGHCYSDIFMGLVLWLSAIIHNSLAGGAHRYVDRVAAVTNNYWWIWSLGPYSIVAMSQNWPNMQSPGFYILTQTNITQRWRRQWYYQVSWGWEPTGLNDTSKVWADLRDCWWCSMIGFVSHFFVLTVWWQICRDFSEMPWSMIPSTEN